MNIKEFFRSIPWPGLSKTQSAELQAGMGPYIREHITHRPSRKQLLAEIDRLTNMLSDPEILRVEIEKGIATVDIKPKDWAVRLLVASFAETIGDAKNYVVLDVGSEELGHYEITIKRYYGKSPIQVHDEQIAAHRTAINKLADLITAMQKAGAEVPAEPKLDEADRAIIKKASGFEPDDGSDSPG